MDLFVACMGGSGSRVANALVNLITVGMFSKSSETINMHILIADVHIGHKDMAKAISASGSYNELKKVFNEESKKKLFNANIITYEWDMLPTLKNIEDKSSIKLSQLAELKKDGSNCDFKASEKAYYLLDALYSDIERTMPITEKGYNAHPSIGAAVCTSAVKFDKADSNNDNNQYVAFCNKIKNSLSSGDTHMALVGSVFGGTGASGLSSLVREFKGLAKNLNGKQGKLLIAGILLLPYFAFEQPSNPSEKLSIKREYFPNSAKTALNYYQKNRLLKNNANNSGFFDAIYLVGFDKPVVRASYNNDDNQENPAHIVELEAAMSICHFFNRKGSDLTTNNTFLKGFKLYKLLNDNLQEPYYILDWSTLTAGDELRKHMGNYLLVGMLFTGYIFPLSFDKQGSKKRVSLPFLQNSIGKMDNPYLVLNQLHDFFIQYMIWCKEISESIVTHIDNSKLFDLSALDKYIKLMYTDNKFSEHVCYDFLARESRHIVDGGDRVSFDAFVDKLKRSSNDKANEYETFLDIVYHAVVN